MSTKGVNQTSFIKHEQIARLARAQANMARLFLVPGERCVIIDMHAGDGRGVLHPQPTLFWGDESTATPILAVEIGETLRRDGYACDIILCEKNRECRQRLSSILIDHDVTILGDHSTIPPLNYRWGLTFNDPNGHGKHGDDTLRRIACEVPRSDFLIIVNEASLRRSNGLKPDQEPGSFAATVFASTERHMWRLAPQEWAKLLGRRHVLMSQSTYGAYAMKGRILLVTNSPQRTPYGYNIISLLDQPRPSQSQPTASSARRYDGETA